MKSSQGDKKQMKKEALESGKKEEEKFGKAYEQMTKKIFKEGVTPQEAIGVNQNILENIYAQAYRLYNTGKYTEATHLFRILIMMNAMEPKYMLGLAACFHMLKEYQNAIQIYTMCGVLDPQNPVPHYHSSDCFIQLEDPVSAMIALEMTIARAKGREEYSTMRERALMTLESLKNQPLSKKVE